MEYAGGCHDGILIDDDIIDTEIYFTVMANDSNAVRVYASRAGTVIQGVVLKGNFVNQCNYGLFLDWEGLNCTVAYGNRWDIAAIDGNWGAGRKGIYANGTVSHQDFIYRGFLGAYTEDAISMTANGCHFEFSLNNGADPTILNNSINITGSNNYKVNLLYNRGRNSTCLATTTSNNLANFNGGMMLLGNHTIVRLNFATQLNAGSTRDFYVFNALCDGFSNNITIQPINQYQASIIKTCEDVSTYAGTDGNKVSKQIHIQVYAVETIPAATNLDCLLKVY
jgi:hypothetical protein